MSQDDAVELEEEPVGLRWQNFRGFRDTGYFELLPLTIIIGPNNCGKSSLLSPLLLLKQTRNAVDPNAALVTRGAHLNLGDFADTVHGHDVRRNMSFEIRYHTHTKETPPQAVGSAPPGAIKLVFGVGKGTGRVILKDYVVEDVYLRQMLRRQLNGSGTYSLSLQGAQAKPEPGVLKWIHSERPRNFSFGLQGLRRAVMGIPDNVHHVTEEVLSRVDQIYKSGYAMEYAQVADMSHEHLGSLLGHLSYVGPLREPPSRVYELPGQKPATVGSKGERAAHYLFFNTNDQAFRARIDRWVRAFGFGDRLHCRDLAGSAFSLEVDTQDSGRVNVADLGFGFSQVLPLIVQSQCATPSSFTLAEQPEIHLNPKLQSLLADLFVEMALSERFVVAETHSEHLLLRLRRLIADRVIPARKCALYFVEREGAQSRLRRIRIQDNGHIDAADWPEGFFGEALEEAYALARAQAQRKSALAESGAPSSPNKPLDGSRRSRKGKQRT